MELINKVLKNKNIGPYGFKNTVILSPVFANPVSWLELAIPFTTVPIERIMRIRFTMKNYYA
tara:strand:+ start:978 stop:1163 length:186 start_codon:yes stop_codon:yes gene_type:complete